MLVQCILRQVNLQYLNMKGIQSNNELTLKILEACSQITSLKAIPAELFRETTFLEESENVELLSNCISIQRDLQNLDISGVQLNDYAAFRIFEVYFSHTKSLTRIPKELFFKNTFLESEENIDRFSQCIGN